MQANRAAGPLVSASSPPVPPSRAALRRRVLSTSSGENRSPPARSLRSGWVWENLILILQPDPHHFLRRRSDSFSLPDAVRGSGGRICAGRTTGSCPLIASRRWTHGSSPSSPLIPLFHCRSARKCRRAPFHPSGELPFRSGVCTPAPSLPSL